MKRKDPISKKHLIDLLSDRSANLGMLANLLQAQNDELLDCDGDTIGDDNDWKYRKNTIITLGNVVKNRLKHYSNEFNNVSEKEYTTGKFDNR